MAGPCGVKQSRSVVTELMPVGSGSVKRVGGVALRAVLRSPGKRTSLKLLTLPPNPIDREVLRQALRRCECRWIRRWNEIDSGAPAAAGRRSLVAVGRVVADHALFGVHALAAVERERVVADVALRDRDDRAGEESPAPVTANVLHGLIAASRTGDVGLAVGVAPAWRCGRRRP